MFTGIVAAAVQVRRFEKRGSGARMWVPAPPAEAGAEPWAMEEGESVAISGTCLTVAGLADPQNGADVPWGTPGADMLFDLSSETLECTWFGDLEVGRAVNLERALALGERLGGHMVSGHVDGRGRISAIEDVGDGGRLFTFEVEPDFAAYLVEKGSVSVDGISLTVVEPKGRCFDVAIIPLTLERTSLGTAVVDQPIHLEADMIGKWIERLLQERGVLS
ncbi:MAG: riboflavin synthase [Planctomycetota bacterium]|nr:riboflavin synthase [Planctomycetota bacterium]